MPNEGENIQLHILDYQEIPNLLTNGRLKNAPCHYGIAMVTTTD